MKLNLKHPAIAIGVGITAWGYLVYSLGWISAICIGFLIFANNLTH